MSRPASSATCAKLREDVFDATIADILSMRAPVGKIVARHVRHKTCRSRQPDHEPASQVYDRILSVWLFSITSR